MKRKTYRRPRRLTLEQLESRRPLAGDVSVNFVDGDLVIIGDAQSNAIVIESTANPEEYIITDAADPDVGPTTLNGTTGPLTMSGITGSVLITLADGSDRVTIDTDSRDLEVAGDLAIDTDLGDDRITSTGNQRIVVGGEFFTDTGDGNDTVSLTSLRVSGSAVINTGTGADQVTLDDTPANPDLSNHVAGNVDLATGDGNDVVNLPGSLTVGGDITFDLGSGDDLLNHPSYWYVSALGDITCLFGDGNDGFVGRGVYAFGDLLIDTDIGNDSCALSGVFVVGHMQVDLGPGMDSLGGSATGADRLTVDGNLTIDSGADPDHIAFSIAQVGGDLVVSTGDGDDSLWMQNAHVAGSSMIDSGDGNDYLLIEKFGFDVDGTILSGNGHDRVIANIGRANTLSIETGSGYDFADARGLIVNAGLMIDTGSESDRVDVLYSWAHTLTINTATGSDVVKIEYSALQAIFATLGDESDSLSILASIARGGASVDGGAGYDLLTTRWNLFAGLAANNFEAFAT